LPQLITERPHDFKTKFPFPSQVKVHHPEIGMRISGGSFKVKAAIFFEETAKLIIWVNYMDKKAKPFDNLSKEVKIKRKQAGHEWFYKPVNRSAL